MNNLLLPIEILTMIFKNVRFPISLTLTCKFWHKISNDPHSRAEWLIEHYGSHALVFAIKLGPNFICVELVECLLAKNINLSKYFMQKLNSNFGQPDEKLNELRYNNGSTTKINSKIWGSDTPIDVYIHLLKKAGLIWKSPHNLCLKGNDMQSFFYLSGGDLPIHQAKIKINGNLLEIEDLILENKFIPLPQRPKQQINDIIKYQENLKLKSNEKNNCLIDGYENNIASNVIPRAIILEPRLVLLWKKIGYKDICYDYNDLVLKAIHLTLFPPAILNSNNDLDIPDITKVVSRLNEFVSLGFKLTKRVMGDVLLLFENELLKIGDLILKSFQIVRNEKAIQILEDCLIQILKPGEDLKKLTVLDFLYEKLENPEEIFLNIMDKHNIGMQYCECYCNCACDNGRNDYSDRFIRLFSLNLNVYSWIFEKFKSDSKITSRCFDEILLAKYYKDSQSILTPTKIEQDESLKTIFKSFKKLYDQFLFSSEIPYKPHHLKYMIKSNDEGLLNRFFKKFLPKLFKIKKNSKTLIFNTELQLNWHEKLLIVANHLFDEKYNGYYNNNLFKKLFEQFCEKLSNVRLHKELSSFNNCLNIKKRSIGEAFNSKQENKKKIKAN